MDVFLSFEKCAYPMVFLDRFVFTSLILALIVTIFSLVGYFEETNLLYSFKNFKFTESGKLNSTSRTASLIGGRANVLGLIIITSLK
jgi:hypothetical protein